MGPYLAEFLGTAVLLLLGCGVNANITLKGTYGNNSGWIVIAFGWAMAVFVAVFITAGASGAHLNPAVTVALAIAKDFPADQVPGYVLAQVTGAIFGAVLSFIQYRPHYAAETDPDKILGTFATGPAIKDTVANFTSEVLATFAFALAVLFLAGPSFNDEEVGLGSLDALSRSLSWCWPSGYHWGARRVTPLTRRATWARVSRTLSYRSGVSGTATGLTPGYPSPGRYWGAAMGRRRLPTTR